MLTRLLFIYVYVGISAYSSICYAADEPNPLDVGFPSVMAFCPASDCNQCRMVAPAQGISAAIIPSKECREKLGTGGLNRETFAYSRATLSSVAMRGTGGREVALSSYDDFVGRLNVCFTTGGGLCAFKGNESYSGSNVLSTIFGGTGAAVQGSSVGEKLGAIERSVESQIAQASSYNQSSVENYSAIVGEAGAEISRQRSMISESQVALAKRAAAFSQQPRPLEANLRQEVAAELRLHQLRSAIETAPDAPDRSGAPDLFRANYKSLGNERPLDQKIALERARLEQGVQAGIVDGLTGARAFGALKAADDFLGANTDFGKRAAEALIQEARSLRLTSSGILRSAETAVINPDGSVGLQKSNGPIPIRGGDLFTQEASFQSSYAAVESRSDLSGPNPTKIKSDDIVALSKRIASDAKALFFGGDLQSGQALISLALDTTNLLTQVTPFVTSGRSALELILGQDLYTGNSLTAGERSVRALNIVVDLWGGKILVGAAGSLINLSKNALETKGAVLVAEDLSRALEVRGLPPDTVTAKALNHVLDGHTIGGSEVVKIPGDKVKTVFNQSFDWVKGLSTTVEQGTIARGARPNSLIFTHTFDHAIGGLPWEGVDAGKIFVQQAYFEADKSGKLIFKSTFPFSPDHIQDWEWIAP